MANAQKTREDRIAENTKIAKHILNKEYNTRTTNKLETIAGLLLKFHENEEILRKGGVFDFYYDVDCMARAHMKVSADGWTRIDYLSLVHVAAEEVQLTTENEQNEISAVSLIMNDAQTTNRRFKVLRVEKVGPRRKALVLDEENKNAIDVFIFWD